MDITEFARKGAAARNAKMTAKQRSAAARKAVNARWDAVRKAQAEALKLAKRKNGAGGKPQQKQK